jgi:hypothetical protein
MAAAFKKGARIEWSWAGGNIQGTVEDVFKESVSKTIKGKKITRHGSPEKPAYLVRSKSGNLALKLQTELRKSSSDKKSWSEDLKKNSRF